VIERLWFGDRLLDRAARSALAPFGAMYGAAVSIRNALFDRGVLASRPVDLATLSVGNLSVGGTGKTPVAAWLVGALRARGGHPGIVLRGYGGDEEAVHRHLNPEVRVIVDSDRVRGIAEARAQGCDLAVLDDAFQHRRAARDEDLVLVSADRWREPARPLPAGPWREPVSALRRATLLVVTRKAAPVGDARTLADRLRRETRTGEAAVVTLRLASLHEAHGKRTLATEQLRGARVLGFAGVADPAAFVAQLRGVGAIVEFMRFSDHHRFTRVDIARIVARAETSDRTVCTLKDLVKVRDVWPRQAPPLWYFSQRVEVEYGMPAVEAVLRRLLDARRPATPTTAG